MYAEPTEPAVAARMRTAHHHACAAMGVQAAAGRTEAWGWRGRTYSRPVTSPGGPAWLRVASAPTGHIATTFWHGSETAEKHIPSTVPRPRLQAVHDWADSGFEYRAELYERVTTQPVATTPGLATPPDLPAAWWADLRTALNAVATVPTDRYTIDQPYLDWAMPQFLGTPLDTRVPSWGTAHGDLHWTNLSAPHLVLFDWEGWGLAPIGYDAAMLHTYSLLVPGTAARVRSMFSDLLDTPAGRFAELVTITELLHSVARGDNLPLAGPLHQRATHLLHRPVPEGRRD